MSGNYFQTKGLCSKRRNLVYRLGSETILLYICCKFLKHVNFCRIIQQFVFCQAINELQFTNPTPIQSAAIPVALMGKDICGCAATGTGEVLHIKTQCHHASWLLTNGGVL